MKNFYTFWGKNEVKIIPLNKTTFFIFDKRDGTLKRSVITKNRYRVARWESDYLKALSGEVGKRFIRII